MGKTERKHQNLLQGSLILGVATLLVKIIGAIYKIPLGWVLGGVGSGYFSIAYDIYLPIFSIAMAGLPVAISRLVAENVSEGRFKDARRLLKVSKRLFLVVGLACFVILAAAIPIYTKYIDEPNALLPMMTIAPSLIFCCIMSTYRGYYEGMRNMYPTAFSQVIEALGKLLIGLLLAYVAKVFLTNEFISSGTVLGREVVLDGSTATLAEVANKMMMPYVASCAILGITLGSAFGALFLVLRHKLVGDKITAAEFEASPEPRSSKSYVKMLILIAVPIV
ncbi:MAG: oligosaccharide flippase family protein, partial [Clostridia bacterium]|nr:oligosaccharide flippase family protein [Clostridia bacterium]